MRLTKEHIGKKIKNLYGHLVTIIALHGDEVWIEYETGTHATYCSTGDYEIVEPKKKPSERIGEIVGKVYPEENIASVAISYIRAIKQFLDEEFAERSEAAEKKS